MNRVKTAVIGVGYLGKFHAEKYALLPEAELIAVCDLDRELCDQIAKKLNVSACYDYKSLIGKVDAVSIATPTPLHHKIGHFFLSHGVHVLMEKPIATTTEAAEDLIKTAKANHSLLQVGHLERFNSAVKAVRPWIKSPRFIESWRLAPFQLRGSDVNVVLDLMIHDIDIIQSIVHHDIRTISANGASVLSRFIDIANARIEFTDGCVANVTASRINLKKERSLRIFQPDNYISVDMDHKKIAYHRKGDAELYPGIPNITREVERFEGSDALKDQIKSFLDAIIHRKQPFVTGEDGKKALAIALEITAIVLRGNEEYPISSA